MTDLIVPINFKKWIDAHRDQLKPPVCNQVVWKDGDFIVMVVGGPNVRNDYHYNETPEFFYQLEGDMVLKIIDNGEFRDVPIKEGEIYLIPPKLRHSPQRFENTVGLVMEQKRPKGVLDALEWYCDNCKAMIYRESFELKDIVVQLPQIFDNFYSSDERRTCKQCNAYLEN